jgi:hypothetical protein
MLYIDLIDGEFSLSREDVRAKRPNMSLPEGAWSDEVFAITSISPMQHTEMPNFDSVTQWCVELRPINVDGHWIQQWQVVDIVQVQP